MHKRRPHGGPFCFLTLGFSSDDIACFACLLWEASEVDFKRLREDGSDFTRAGHGLVSNDYIFVYNILSFCFFLYQEVLF